MTKWTEDKISSELKKVIDKLGKFPTCTELLKENRSDIINALKNTGISIFYFQKKFGFTQTRKESNYWASDDNLEAEIKSLVTQLGYFPTQDELIKLGKSAIYHAIRKRGKISDYKTKFGFKTNQKPQGYWKSWDNLEKEIRPLIKNT